MKKTLLTAALGCAMITSAFADGGPVSEFGTLTATVADYITMLPNGNFGNASFSYNDPTSQTTFQTIPAVQFTITASRSWNVKHSASNFVRTPSSTNPAISNSVAPGNVLGVLTNGGTPASVVTAGGYNPATVTGTIVASQNQGTLDSKFSIAGRIAPGLTNQMSGSYVSNIAVVASLD